MHVLQRLRFPRTPGATALCFAHGSTAVLDQTGEAGPAYRFQPGQTLSASSYLNSFFEFPHRTRGAAREFFLRLRLAGDFEVTVWGQAFGGEPRALWRESLRHCAPEAPVLAPLPLPGEGEPNQRLYFTLTALPDGEDGEGGAFFGGDIATPHAPAAVRLAVVLCTFRREDYLRATVRGLLADADLGARLSDIIVVDNGRTLDPAAFAAEFPDPRATLIPNRNCGGAGGFSRGMAEALDRGRATHLLLMDDDILCDSEAVLRTIAFFEHADAPVAVAGAMLDLMKPHLLFEAGALYGRAADLPGENPLKILGLKRGLCLEHDGALNTLLLDEHADYGAWWFFAFPARCAREHGLALPFFVIGDDIEFGLRLTRRQNVPVLPLPGVGVWHLPFYSKISSVKRYFFVRNLLVIDALHGESSYWRIARALLADLENDLCRFNYGMVLMLVRAFEDFLRGPGLFTRVEPEALMSGLAAEAKGLDDNLREFTPTETFGFEQPARDGLLRGLVRRLSLGGHLLPKCLLRGAPMQVWVGGAGQWRKNFLCREARFLHREAGFSGVRDIDQELGRGLAFRLFKALWNGRGAWEKARAAWRREAGRLSSPEFWKDYCAATEQARPQHAAQAGRPGEKKT